MGQRMTVCSVENIKVAERAGYRPVLDPDGKEAGITVWVERKDARVFLSGRNGPMVYKNRQEARRAVKRIRQDLEPTDI